jgi:nitronate monooxygenase
MMLHTYLTDRLGLRYPIIGAPMAGAAGGRLARAISEAGGLGCIGIGSTTSLSFIEAETAIARGSGDTQFGLGLMAWALSERPELLDAAIDARPTLISISFGSIAPYVKKVRTAGIILATQVQTITGAREAEAAGVDLIVAQGTEAGGHSSSAGVGTLTLLQGVLGAVELPVVAAGGIATPAGLAAVLAAGAQGGWVGTALLLAAESQVSEEARLRIAAATETDTILTDVFDRVQELDWPSHHPGRALRNRFAREWHGKSQEIAANRGVIDAYRRARDARDYDTAVIYAGQAVGLVREERSTEDIVRELGDGAEALLRRRFGHLTGE